MNSSQPPRKSSACPPDIPLRLSQDSGINGSRNFPNQDSHSQELSQVCTQDLFSQNILNPPLEASKTGAFEKYSQYRKEYGGTGKFPSVLGSSLPNKAPPPGMLSWDSRSSLNGVATPTRMLGTSSLTNKALLPGMLRWDSRSSLNERGTPTSMLVGGPSWRHHDNDERKLMEQVLNEVRSSNSALTSSLSNLSGSLEKGELTYGELTCKLHSFMEQITTHEGSLKKLFENQNDKQAQIREYEINLSKKDSCIVSLEEQLRIARNDEDQRYSESLTTEVLSLKKFFEQEIKVVLDRVTENEKCHAKMFDRAMTAFAKTQGDENVSKIVKTGLKENEKSIIAGVSKLVQKVAQQKELKHDIKDATNVVTSHITFENQQLLNDIAVIVKDTVKSETSGILQKFVEDFKKQNEERKASFQSIDTAAVQCDMKSTPCSCVRTQTNTQIHGRSNQASQNRINETESSNKSVRTVSPSGGAHRFEDRNVSNLTIKGYSTRSSRELINPAAAQRDAFHKSKEELEKGNPPVRKYVTRASTRPKQLAVKEPPVVKKAETTRATYSFRDLTNNNVSHTNTKRSMTNEEFNMGMRRNKKVVNIYKSPLYQLAVAQHLSRPSPCAVVRPQRHAHTTPTNPFHQFPSEEHSHLYSGNGTNVPHSQRRLVHKDICSNGKYQLENNLRKRSSKDTNLQAFTNQDSVFDRTQPFTDRLLMKRAHDAYIFDEPEAQDVPLKAKSRRYQCWNDVENRGSLNKATFAITKSPLAVVNRTPLHSSKCSDKDSCASTSSSAVTLTIRSVQRSIVTPLLRRRDNTFSKKF